MSKPGIGVSRIYLPFRLNLAPFHIDPIWQAGKTRCVNDLLVESVTIHGKGPFSFKLEGGKCLGISGPSGAGKSLLLRAIADIEPHPGTVSLNGVEYRAITGPAWRKRVAMLPSDPLWWHPTIGDHFDTAAGLPWVRALGFDKDVFNWPVTRLSSGERQRLGLARTISRKPSALLLDEPTANLDEARVELVETAIATYQRDKNAPIVWVSHNKDQLTRVADDLITIQGLCSPYESK